MNNSSEARIMEEVKRREYLKQQQLLRNMSRPKHNLSADAMIENLLSKKEIFQKKAPPPQKPGGPTACSANITVPASYLTVWEWCKQAGSVNGMEVCDTTKLYTLLMTSRLSVDTLGYIWSLSNLTVPGCLTQQELYTTLALVALAQSGYSFRSVAVISQMGRYPVPVLDMSMVEKTSGSTAQAAPLSQQTDGKSQEDDDEFDDFKSADLSCLSVDNLKVLEVGTLTPASLIRFDSPKRPPAALSLLDSPCRNSPTQLSVLDLPLTETSHQPPFERVTTPPPEIDPPDKVSPDPINSISGGLLVSPHHVEDLFPKCSNVSRSNDLLDWVGTPPDQQEEYLTCDLVTNTIQISSSCSRGPTPNIIPNPLVDDASYSDFTSNSSPEPNKDKSSQDSISVDSLRFDDLKLSDVQTQHCGKCLDSDKRLASMDFDDFPVETVSKTESPDDVISRSSTDNEPPDGSNLISSFPTSSSCAPPDNTSIGLLDLEDKYSALRSLEVAETDTCDDFGDFMAAEPLSQLQVSPPPTNLQTNIKEQCIEACLDLLNQAITSFKSVSNEKVLNEILDHHRCKKYLEELGEVYRICERLVRGNEQAKEKLESTWTLLGEATRQALPPIKVDDILREGVKCGVCQEQSRLEEQVSYAMNHFHAACASLYLHAVPGSTLPLQPL